MNSVRLVLLVSCCALSVSACGAGDNRLDPGDLELRDVLGIAPEVATAWDHDQRAAARHVVEEGLHQASAPAIRARLGTEPGVDHQIATALAAADADRARHAAGALGVVNVAVGASNVVATPRSATLEPRPRAPIAIQLSGWDGDVLAPLPARGMAVLAELAADAGHRSGALIVSPAPRLAVAAGYVPATATEPARLVVNPVVLAVLEPDGPEVVARSTGGTGAPILAPTAIPANGPGNPYSFYGSVAECAAAQKTRCDACVSSSGPCQPITNTKDGLGECTALADGGGRGFFLICINLALAIDSVSSCTAGRAPDCARDTHASNSLDALQNNARFLDDTACSTPLDLCLETLYGPLPPSSTDNPPPRNTSIDCGDSCSGDSNCEADPNCEIDGSTCDSGEETDSGCSSSNEQSSGCGDSGSSNSSGGACDDSGESSCDSGDGGSCDSGGGDCGGGGGDSSCDSGGGGDCGGGGGGDCGGGGGDCGGGGGGDCNAGRRGSAGGGLPLAILWAFLPVPFATRVRRRAVRRRARAEAGEVES